METVTINSLRDYLEWRANCAFGGLMEATILKHGREGKPMRHKYRMRKEKQCFMNATHLALDNDGLTYVEGIAQRAALGIPLSHAWVIDKDGHVIDPTWRRREGWEGDEYFGIPFEREALERELLRNRVYGILDLGVGCYNMRLLSEIDGPLVESFIEKHKRARA